MIDRRVFIALAAAASDRSKAQPVAKPWRIGWLSDVPPVLGRPGTRWDFIDGMRDLGLEEGRDYVFVPSYHNNVPERASLVAVELARQPIDIMVATTTLGAQAAKQATATIPIVFWSNDPVATGLVESLAHPGGNLTGVSFISIDLNGKRVQILCEAVPGLRSLAILWNPGYPTTPAAADDAEQAARRLGVDVRRILLRSANELSEAIDRMAQQRPGAVFLADQTLYYNDELVAIPLFAATSRLHLPVMAPNRQQADAGALISYGVNFPAGRWRMAVMVEKILGRGVKPADLPVEQPTQFELVINLKTARAIGATIPQSLLLRADKVIQ